MGKKNLVSSHRDFYKKGEGIASSTVKLLSKPFSNLLNRTIDILPIELHLPGGYQYCGPGTKLAKRLARKDPGINKLDQACKEHDIAYSKYSDSAHRTAADRILATQAWNRVKSSDASVREKAAALAVTAAMKAKTTFGGGKTRRKRGGGKTTKRGGNIKRQRKTRRSSKKTKPSIWSMIKKGQGLYLRPYRVY